MKHKKFILLRVKENGNIMKQYVNTDHILKIYENDKQEIIVELSDYSILKLDESNISSLMDRFIQ